MTPDHAPPPINVTDSGQQLLPGGGGSLVSLTNLSTNLVWVKAYSQGTAKQGIALPASSVTFLDRKNHGNLIDAPWFAITASGDTAEVVAYRA